mmetsp:Transcript_42609/g.88742  ORF Transcript_42609/g.88742 Transcript_42609/m.88742 type:complete len:322 (+) Transcript_42609:648-1613(+)
MSSSAPLSPSFALFVYCLRPAPSPQRPMMSNALTVLLRPFTMRELVSYPSARINCSAIVDFCTPTVGRLSDKPTREPVETSSISGPSKAVRRFRSMATAASILVGSEMLHNSSHSRVMFHRASICPQLLEFPHAASARVSKARRLMLSWSSSNSLAYFRTYAGFVKKLECFLKPSSKTRAAISGDLFRRCSMVAWHAYKCHVMGPGGICVGDAAALSWTIDFRLEGFLPPMDGSNRFVTIQSVPFAFATVALDEDSSTTTPASSDFFSPVVEDSPEIPPSYPWDSTRRALANTARDACFPLYRRTSRWYRQNPSEVGARSR